MVSIEKLRALVADWEALAESWANSAAMARTNGHTRKAMQYNQVAAAYRRCATELGQQIGKAAPYGEATDGP